MRKRTIEVAVGIFVLAGLASLTTLALKVGNFDTAEMGGYTLTGRFENVGGLNVKAPVTMAGVRVGRVKDIRIDRDDFNALVVMQIDSRFDNLPKDTSASILTAGLLGAQFVSLEPGGDEEHLKNGDEIFLTQSAVILEQLIGQMIFSQSEGGDK